MFVGSTSPSEKVRVSMLAEPLAGRQGGRSPVWHLHLPNPASQQVQNSCTLKKETVFL